MNPTKAPTNPACLSKGSLRAASLAAAVAEEALGAERAAVEPLGWDGPSSDETSGAETSEG